MTKIIFAAVGNAEGRPLTPVHRVNIDRDEPEALQIFRALYPVGRFVLLVVEPV